MRRVSTPVERLGLAISAAAAIAVALGSLAIGFGEFNEPAPQTHLKFVKHRTVQSNAYFMDAFSTPCSTLPPLPPLPDSLKSRGYIATRPPPCTDLSKNRAPTSSEQIQIDADRNAEEDFEENGGMEVDLANSKFDDWTPYTLTRASLMNTADAIMDRSPDQPTRLAMFYGIRSLAVGLFLWLLYEPTVGALLRWIRYGNTPPNS